MIGGYAYNLYRNPRATGDIDFFVAISDTNEQLLRKSLIDFGFGASLRDDSAFGDGEDFDAGAPPLTNRHPN